MRTLITIRDFYRDEVERLGLVPRTFDLELDRGGPVNFHGVGGDQPYSAYARESDAEIRKHCKAALAPAGINLDRETVVIFYNMADWDPAARSITQNSPYYANGSETSDTGWLVDSPILDPDLLPEKGRPVPEWAGAAP